MHVPVADVRERERAGPHSQVVYEVVDAVVLRRLARARVAADDRRAVNGYGQIILQSLNFQLGEVLRLLVKISEARLVPQLAFEYDAGALARDVAGRDVVVAPQILNRAREAVDVARSLD